MAFTLALSSTPEQSNDAKILSLSDNSTTWVTGSPVIPFPDYANNNYSIGIQIDIREPDTTTVCDEITYPGPYTSMAEMVYEITCANLAVSSVAIGTADDMLPDGLYDVTYVLRLSGVIQYTYTTTLVVLGQIKIDIANDFADVPNNWTRKELSLLSDEILVLVNPLYKESNYEAIISNPYQADETKMLNIIDFLTSLIND